MKLDKTDRRILDVLQRDGRISVTDLAERVGLSPTPCARRIKQLEAAGLIQGYAAIVDPKRAGQTIQDVVERVARMAGVVGEIATDAQQQCLDMDGVSRKIADVEASNRENSSLLQNARESARELQLLAGELGGAVGRFRIEGAATADSEEEEKAKKRAARA